MHFLARSTDARTELNGCQLTAVTAAPLPLRKNQSRSDLEIWKLSGDWNQTKDYAGQKNGSIVQIFKLTWDPLTLFPADRWRSRCKRNHLPIQRRFVDKLDWKLPEPSHSLLYSDRVWKKVELNCFLELNLILQANIPECSNNLILPKVQQVYGVISHAT